jgi:hypothetical protein
MRNQQPERPGLPWHLESGHQLAKRDWPLKKILFNWAAAQPSIELRAHLRRRGEIPKRIHSLRLVVSVSVSNRGF